MAEAKPAKPVHPIRSTQQAKSAGAGRRVPRREPPPTAPSDPGRGGRGRPVLLVLAGVNGAGKSSIGGNVMLRRAGLSWFNPDHYTRMLVQTGVPHDEANARAWQYGVELLDQAVAQGHSHALETTLGGRTMTQRIAAAAPTHEVLVWYCGLASPELHIARVAQRVAAGGHHIPPEKIRERWLQAPLNLIALLPHLSELRVYDNSAQAAPGSPVDDPVLVLHLRSGQVQFPATLHELQRTPQWAKPIVMAARQLAALAPAQRKGRT